MKINIQFYSGNTRKNQIIKAVKEINKIQTYYDFSLKESKYMDVCSETIIDWNNFSKSYIPVDEEYLIYITEKSFSDNWFSHEQNQYAIISTNDWEEQFSPPSLNVYLMY